MRISVFLLFVILMTGCCHLAQSDGYDVLIGNGDELTLEEREQIWKHLSQYYGKNIQEDIGRREAFRVHTLFRRLGMFHMNEPVRHLFKMKDANGQEYSVLVSSSTYRNPGTAYIEFNVYQNGFPVAGDRFAITRMRLYSWLGDISLAGIEESYGDVLKIDTHFNAEVTSLHFVIKTDGHRIDSKGLVEIERSYRTMQEPDWLSDKSLDYDPFEHTQKSEPTDESQKSTR